MHSPLSVAPLASIINKMLLDMHAHDDLSAEAINSAVHAIVQGRAGKRMDGSNHLRCADLVSWL